MDDQHEEVEHIPWGELLTRTDDGRRRILYLAAGALAAMVLGVVVTRAMSSPSPPQPVAPAVEVVATTVPMAAPTPAVPSTVGTAPDTTTTITTLAVPMLYREADLMAFPPDLAARAAVTRAEWFVTSSGI